MEFIFLRILLLPLISSISLGAVIISEDPEQPLVHTPSPPPPSPSPLAVENVNLKLPNGFTGAVPPGMEGIPDSLKLKYLNSLSSDPATAERMPELKLKFVSSTSTAAPPTTERIPDDYLHWFFHHSFKKLDQFFQEEDERERKLPGGGDEVEGEDDPVSKNWKIRVSKVILKLILIILAIVGSILFVLGMFLFMTLSFLVFKFLGHFYQCFREHKKRKLSSTAYQVNI